MFLLKNVLKQLINNKVVDKIQKNNSLFNE